MGERPGCAREGLVNMDADALCIVCNWVNDGFWPYGGLGGLGAAAGGFFGGGFFGGSGGGDNDDSGVDETEIPENQRPAPRYPPGVVPPSRLDNPYTQYSYPSGEPYWPGVSEIPDGGVVVYTGREGGFRVPGAGVVYGRTVDDLGMPDRLVTHPGQEFPLQDESGPPDVDLPEYGGTD